MNNLYQNDQAGLLRNRVSRSLPLVAILAVLIVWSASPVAAQDFDFDRLRKTAGDYLVVVKVKVELSFGMQTNEAEQRLLGTIVTSDGLVMFDGSFISDHNPLSPMSSFSFRSRPTRIEVITLDEQQYDAEYIGVDRETRFAFARITSDEETRFNPVRFVSDQEFRIGQWLALYMLLPEYVKPSLAADVGMLSVHVEQPEAFPLIVGFSPFERAAVLFNEDSRAVGVLGSLSNPADSDVNAGGMMDSFGEADYPLLGVVTAERLEKLITDPPEKGKVDRAWLGITLQALTEDIAEFLGVDVPGGIIVNEVVPQSPAEEAGLQVGDVIYAINDEQVEVDREEELPVFQRRVSNMGSDAKAEFSVLRPSETGVDTLRAIATLRAAPLAASDAPEYEDEDLEFKVRDIVFTDYMVYNVEQGTLEGVVVSELSQGGLANIAGMQIGDVIQKVDGVEVASVEDVESAMARVKSENPEELVFFIWRFGKTMFLNVKMQ